MPSVWAGDEVAELRFQVDMFKKWSHLELDKLGEDGDYWDGTVLEHELSGKFAPIFPPPVLCFLFVRSAAMVAGKDMDDFHKMFPRPVQEETSSDEDEAPAAAGKTQPQLLISCRKSH